MVLTLASKAIGFDFGGIGDTLATLFWLTLAAIAVGYVGALIWALARDFKASSRAREPDAAADDARSAVRLLLAIGFAVLCNPLAGLLLSKPAEWRPDLLASWVTALIFAPGAALALALLLRPTGRTAAGRWGWRLVDLGGVTLWSATAWGLSHVVRGNHLSLVGGLAGAGLALLSVGGVLVARADAGAPPSSS